MRNYLIAFIYVAAPILIIVLFRNFRFFSKIGTVIMAYGIGIIMSLSGIMRWGGSQKRYNSWVTCRIGS